MTSHTERIRRWEKNPRNRLSYWKKDARKHIFRWLTNERFRDEVTSRTLKNEYLGPFTKFLYWYASKSQCAWGVMIDFNERSQRVYLTDHYYKWMHRLRDEIEEKIES